MITNRNLKFFGILLAIILIIWGIAPILKGEQLNNDAIASSIILILIGVAYPIIVFKPEWNKAVLLIEGIIIGVAGYTLLVFPHNIGFGILGVIIIMIAILAYRRKLPDSLLKFFYKG